MGPSVFTDASHHWLKCIWLLSPRLSSWVLGIACLDQIDPGDRPILWNTINFNIFAEMDAQNTPFFVISRSTMTVKIYPFPRNLELWWLPLIMLSWGTGPFLCCFQTSSPHCRFDGDFCTTAQAPLTAKERPSSEQRQANQAFTSLLCPQRHTADSWLVFNLRVMLLGGKAKAAWPLRVATLKQQAVIRRWNGNVVSGRLVWN